MYLFGSNLGGCGVLKKRLGLLIAIFTALFIFSGCSISEIDKLYSLPKPAQEYLQLQKLIDAEIAAGSEYSAPTAGSLRQSIQLTDLDGDGTNEALVFLRNGDSQPEICVYRKIDGIFNLSTVIKGEGTAIGRIEYADINGDGVSEILVSWEVSSELRLVKAYSIKDWESSVLLTASCIDFQIGDLNSDGITDILTLSLETSGGKVDMYTIDSHNEVIQKSAKLSGSFKTVDRFRIADIENKVPAIFVEGQFRDKESSSLITDIVIYTGGELKNITVNSVNGDSPTKRDYPVYSTDIDGNGSLDVPIAEKLKPSQGNNEYYVFDWYSFNASGKSELCASTYHCYTDGWYFTLPTEWRKNISIRRESSLPGERATVFSTLDENGKETDLLTVYTLSDENRIDRAKLNNRFVLLSSQTTIYAAELNTDGDNAATESEKQEIINRFHLIYTEWNTGDL
jgi:hypothetical protein